MEAAGAPQVTHVVLAFVVAGLTALGAWSLAWPVLGIWLMVRRFAGRASLARWTPVTMLAPVVVVAGLIAAAVAFPTIETIVRQECHCLAEPASVHLCVRHPELAAPLVPLSILGWLLMPGVLAAIRAAGGRLLAQRSLAARARSSVERPRVLLVDLGQPNAFATTNGTILIDAPWWQTLDATERTIVLAHEQAHLKRHDPWLLHALMLAVSWYPRQLGRACLRDWRAWAESRADARAADEVGDRSIVAEFLVRQHRRACGAPSSCPLPGPALHGDAPLERRVRHLLAGMGDGDPLAPDLDWRAVLVLTLLVALPLYDMSALHEAVEALGRFMPSST